MRLISACIICLLAFMPGFSQKNDIEVFEKKTGNKNIVIARNTGKVPYMVTLTITATGMNVTPGMKIEALVPAGYMKEMATLEPIPGQSWNYGFEVAFIESTPPTPSTPKTVDSSSPALQPTVSPDPSASDLQAPVLAEGIVVYTKPSCGRCTVIKKEMNAKGVTYQEIDITTASPDVNNMWQMLRESGFTGTSVTMPVVRYNGEFHYNIKDIPGLVEKMKTGAK